MSRRPSTSMAVTSSIDRIVEGRYGNAIALVDDVRARQRARSARSGRPGEPTVDAVVDEIVRRYSRELAAVAALSGGAAAMPGTGAAAAVVATGADVAYTTGRLAEMVLAIGVAYGHDARSIEERRAWVLAVLSMGKGAASGVEGLAGRIGQQGGARLAHNIGSTQLDAVNSKLAAKMLARVATEQTAARMGRVLPFGIGAGIGATGNLLIVRSVSRAARRFFASGPESPPPPMPFVPHGATGPPGRRIDDDVIDVEVIDES